jgi:hypothetical protein
MMDYNGLKDLVGEDNAILVYDYFVGFTVDNLVQLVLDGYAPSQLLHLAKQLREDVDDEQS